MFSSEHSSEFWIAVEFPKKVTAIFNTLGEISQIDDLFDIVWDPFYEIRRVLVLNVQHLFMNFFGGHSSSEKGGGC